MLRLKPRFFSHRQEAVAFLVLLGVCMIATMPFRARAQAKPTIAGDYLGTLGPLHVKLHLKMDPLGSVTGTLDSPDQGANGIACADFSTAHGKKPWPTMALRSPEHGIRELRCP
jgi:hypothetical protein